VLKIRFYLTKLCDVFQVIVRDPDLIDLSISMKFQIVTGLSGHDPSLKSFRQKSESLFLAYKNHDIPTFLKLSQWPFKSGLIHY
jgi:hypothetical protein